MATKTTTYKGFVFVSGESLVGVPAGNGMGFNRPAYADRATHLSNVGAFYDSREQALAFEPWHPDMLREAELVVREVRAPSARKAGKR